MNLFRKGAILLVAGCMGLPALASNPVTVDQLAAIVAKAQTKMDGEAAKELSGLELTERLSSARYEQLRVVLPGDRSKEALLALADVSAFLDPPASDIPATATPDKAAQRRMMGLTVNYLSKTLPLLPNLFAARDVVRFEGRPVSLDASQVADNSLREVSKSRATVLYRDGREFVDPGQTKDKKPQAPDKGMTTWGEFGPIMGTVLIDAARSNLVWSHWELSGNGPQAVFQYAVPKEKSHYDVRFCCVAESYGMEINILTQRTGYHGEITIDPDSGTILRLTVISDLPAGNPIEKASIAVEYGAVDIGGKTYYCPIKGIALADAPDLKAMHAALNPPPGADSVSALPSLQKASLSSITHQPQQTLLNDIAFREFHLFRSNANMVVTSTGAVATRPAPAPGAATEEATASAPAAPSAPVPDTAVDASTMAAPPPGTVASETVTTVTPMTPVAEAAPPEASLPEMSVTGVSGLPTTAAAQASGADSGALLHVTARLVDVSLVALDKKGRPITNLKPEDLEIYDEGHKVDVKSFTPAGTTASTPPAATPQGTGTPEVHHAYSNHTLANLKSGAAPEQGNTIVLLIDSNLSWDDLMNVREEMKRFLNGLQGGEQVAIYVMRTGAIQLLHEATNDHAVLTAALAKWTPSAQNISLGQEQEARNRQSMDYVEHYEDLANVNGLGESDTNVNVTPLGASLRPMGDDPGGNAIAGMMLLARHLAAIPGHKSLVWIASDNVLADWTKSAINIDKGSRNIEPSALRAQEAMNDAHTSVYPLDASRLEAGGIDASIGTRNVEANPVNFSYPGQGALQGPEASAGRDLNTDQSRDLTPGRSIAQMQQDTHSIQGIYREIADATGGRTFRRASDIVMELNGIAADGRATYLLSFTPAMAADGKYHMITIKMPGRKDVHLQYRTGFFYRQEPATVQDRFKQTVLQPEDAAEIAVAADPVLDANKRSLKLNIAAADLALAQKDAFWTDKVDVYLVQREAAGAKAHVTGQSIGLRLKPGTYQQYLREGIPFNQVLEIAPGVETVRVVVLDENSGRMGSVTVPASALKVKQ